MKEVQKDCHSRVAPSMLARSSSDILAFNARAPESFQIEVIRRGSFGTCSGTVLKAWRNKGAVSHLPLFNRLPWRVGHAAKRDRPEGIRNHRYVGSQGLFKLALPPSGALSRLKILSVSAFSSRALTLFGIFFALGIL